MRDHLKRQLALAGGIREAREAVSADAGRERQQALGTRLLLRRAGAVKFAAAPGSRCPHAFCAELNAGDPVIVALSWIVRWFPLICGSGKLATPCLRMHAGYL